MFMLGKSFSAFGRSLYTPPASKAVLPSFRTQSARGWLRRIYKALQPVTCFSTLLVLNPHLSYLSSLLARQHISSNAHNTVKARLLQGLCYFYRHVLKRRAKRWVVITSLRGRRHLRLSDTSTKARLLPTRLLPSLASCAKEESPAWRCHTVPSGTKTRTVERHLRHVYFHQASAIHFIMC